MSSNSRTTFQNLITHMLIILMIVSTFGVFTIMNTEPASAMDKVVKITGSSLNVRSNAGTSYKKVGTVKKGEYKIVLGSKKDSKKVVWYKITVGKKTGYVSSKYTKAVSFSVTSLSGKTGTVKVSSGTLTSRSGPGTIFAKVASLKNGKKVTVTGKVKDVSGTYWYRYKLNGVTGYVSSKYMTLSNTATTDTTTATKPSSTETPDAGATTSTTKPSTSNTTTTATTTTTTSGSSSSTTKFTIGTVSTSSSSLNVRTGAGTSYSILGTLANGAVITITGSAKSTTGETWYKYAYSSSKTGYVCSTYIKTSTVSTDDDFEAYMTKQGFPESYKAGLRALHAAHPKWTFKAVNVGCSWTTALNAETKNVGTNLVSPSLPSSYRSTASGAYNSKTKTWTKFDGSWYAASPKVVAYYMDPRNFLNENGVYQFMTHQYDASSQNVNTVKAVVKGSFMETRKTGNATYSDYASLINYTGKVVGVNPNVIAAMIVQEQGVKGTSGLISGTYSGYKGYYNFFNIGAYTTSTMSAVQRGLWYAKQSGSYERPWSTVYKSIKGGALFYGTNYVNKKQDTYYYKKFNVKNGTSAIATHQYMTNVSAAASEGKLLKAAFSSNSSYAAIIEIPIYSSMPADACPLP
ncbi:MAG: SH3 domain-containing protein [Eubacterium sp.]|nr:SH3 domain-containing protein [Candidatus Colimonas fimequi]